MERRQILGVLGTTGLIGMSSPVLAKITASDVLSALGARAVSSKDADAAIRESLKQGTVSSVAQVGKIDGYWGDDLVRIPLPKTLLKVQKFAKPLGLSGPLDEVHEKMNRAAEAAAPLAKDLFWDAITSMTIKDAVGIVKGGSNSGTLYLQKATSPRLITAFTPPMEGALQSTGAVQSLERAIERNQLKPYVKTDAKTYLAKHAVGLALNGLFYYLGEAETKIRKDPAGTGSALMKRVFG